MMPGSALHQLKQQFVSLEPWLWWHLNARVAGNGEHYFRHFWAGDTTQNSLLQGGLLNEFQKEKSLNLCTCVGVQFVQLQRCFCGIFPIVFMQNT